jgi:hypothetical protein
MGDLVCLLLVQYPTARYATRTLQVLISREQNVSSYSRPLKRFSLRLCGSWRTVVVLVSAEACSIILTKFQRYRHRPGITPTCPSVRCGRAGLLPQALTNAKDSDAVDTQPSMTSLRHANNIFVLFLELAHVSLQFWGTVVFRFNRTVLTRSKWLTGSLRKCRYLSMPSSCLQMSPLPNKTQNVPS